MRDHKPRAQKRQEYKQVIGLLVLVLAVAAVSFALGVAVGKRGTIDVASQINTGVNGEKSADQKTEKVEASPEDAPKVNLTFYDTLPKGEETPLGSGINPAPESPEASAQGTESGEGVASSENVRKSSVPKTSAGQETEKVKPPPVTSGEYVVQVASFKSEGDARELQKRMLAKGHRALLQRVDLKEKGVWTRVYIGFFNSRESAQLIVDRLTVEDRLSPMIRRRE